MANRTVAVRLTAEVGSYIQGTKNAAKATRDLSRDVSREAVKNKQAWNEVGQGMLAFGATAGVGVGLAVKRFADFDESMSKVKAATHESAAAMDDLREAALQAGARTSFSATEAAAGIEELAKAGVSTASILNGGLNGALDLAASGGIAVADAAEIAATSMTQFGLEGGKVPHIADLLSAAAAKAQGGVGDMGMALKQAGLVANQTGLSIEETTAGLASFASAGLVGSDAGTSFKSMLQRLTPQSAEAAGRMEELGISAYDAQGQFVGLEAFAGNLRESLQALTPEQRNSAMATIFGSDAVRAAAVLYDQGAEGIRRWTGEVNDQGHAAETAAIRLDNLKGDIEELSGSIETALITSGAGANTVLREMVQAVTGVVNAYSALPSGVQTGVTAVGTVASAVGLAGGAFLLAVPKVQAFRLAIGEMGPATQRVAGGFGRMAGALAGPLGLALTAGTVALAVYGRERAQAKARVEEFTAAIERDSGALGENTRATVVAALEKEGLLQTAQGLGLSLEDVTDAVLGEGDALERVNAVLDEHINSSQNGEQAMGYMGERALEVQQSLNGMNGATEDAAAAARRNAEALGEEAAAAGPAAAGLAAVGGAAAAAAPAVAELTDLQESLADALDSFVHPLGTYQEVLQAKEAAERASAEATAAATESSKDSWEDYASDVTVTLTDLAEALEADNQAHADWQTNLVKVAAATGSDVAAHLAEMGEEGVRLTALMANGTGEETARAAEAIRANMALGRDGAERELDAMVLMAGAKGKLTAEAIAEQVGIGVERVRELAGQYGIVLAAGIDPILTAIGRERISTGRPGQGTTSGGTTVYADGGVEDHVAQIAPGGAWRVWAEPETGGEAYIPLSPAKRKRSIDIWRETGRRLGEFAVGGFNSVDDVPKPPSSHPLGPPVSTVTDRALDLLYGEAAEFVRANAAPHLGSAPGVDAMMAALRVRFPGLALISGLRPGAITATGNASYHGMGRAVDIPPQMDVFDWLAQNYRNSRELIFSPAGGRQLRNGNPHVYSGVTKAMHYDHIHWAMKNGGILNPHVRDKGGPLLPGFTYNGTGRPEMVLPMAGGGILGRQRSRRGPNFGDGFDLSVVAAGLGSVEEIRALVEAWEDYNAELERAARRVELVAAAEEAHRQVVTAEAAATKEQKAAVQALENAQRRLAQAKGDTAKENAAVAVRQAQEKVDRTSTEQLTQAREALARANEAVSAHDFAEDRLRELDAVEQLIQGLEDEAEAREKAADAARVAAEWAADLAETTKRAQDDALQDVNRMLDEEQRLRARDVEVVGQHAEAVADVQGRQVEAEADYYLRRAALGRDFNAEQQRILDARRDALTGWAPLDQVATPAWGNTVDQLVGNARDQLMQFEEWMQELSNARARGVSEAVIASLGLDEGPQALGQLRQFGRATAAEIDTLNATVAQRTAMAGAQTAREQQNLYGELGRALVESRARYVEDLGALDEAYRLTQDELVDQIETLNDELLLEQAQVAQDLAVIGQDQGRSYGEALAAGLTSQIPAVAAAAAALQAAAASATAAAAQAKDYASRPGAPGQAAPGAPPLGTAGSFTLNGRQVHVNEAGIIDTPGDYYGMYPAQVLASGSRTGSRVFGAPRRQTYDVGGWLEPGFTLAYNGTGQRERVVTAQQAQGGTTLVVNLNGTVLGVDQLQQTVRTGVQAVLSEQRTGMEVAGRRG